MYRVFGRTRRWRTPRSLIRRYVSGDRRGPSRGVTAITSRSEKRPPTRRRLSTMRIVFGSSSPASTHETTVIEGARVAGATGRVWAEASLTVNVLPGAPLERLSGLATLDYRLAWVLQLRPMIGPDGTTGEKGSLPLVSLPADRRLRCPAAAEDGPVPGRPRLRVDRRDGRRRLPRGQVGTGGRHLARRDPGGG